MSEVKEWLNDGHKILAILDTDQIHPEVKCPADNPYANIGGLKCGRGSQEPKGMPDSCVVKEAISEYGWEMNCSGLKIMVRGLIPIEWGFDGIDASDFYFKCAGYPSYDEAQQFKQEAIRALVPDLPIRFSIPSEMFPMLPMRPWSEVDEETKDSLRQDIEDYVEERERKYA
jgi:hypothetical protein